MRKKSLLKLSSLVLGAVLTTGAFAQSNFGISLYSNINLSTFGSGSGNDCWGYVSPSGREYAIMGLNNKVAFVDITNPASPVVKATIPHSSSLWGAIKVYGQYVYAATEQSGTGIQVIDMGQIDNGIVTLVKTIASPGRTHTLALNAQSGFLYTCGSREGTGWSMCFSLLNPANPVQVGANSMTTDYNHECIVVSYTTGPYAGKEIWFGFSEGRGVDIYDVTNKNAPTLIKRVTYPNMGYCHQGWLSADRKYLYVDDEFDENNLNTNTRSLIFNVEDLANASYVGTFSSNLPSIDHNQYVTDGFAFQANYTTGLRIFDTTQNPTSPIQVGGYDTYTANNNPTYNGAWSNYPFFPSGTVIVSDIDGGLFILDPTEATTRNQAPWSFTVPESARFDGTLADLGTSDNNKVVISRSVRIDSSINPYSITLTGYAHDTNPTKIRLLLESAGLDSVPMSQTVELFDWTTNSYVPIDTRNVGNTDTIVNLTAPGAVARFVHDTDLKVLARVRWNESNVPRTSLPRVAVDQFQFRITR